MSGESPCPSTTPHAFACVSPCRIRCSRTRKGAGGGGGGKVLVLVLLPVAVRSSSTTTTSTAPPVVFGWSFSVISQAFTLSSHIFTAVLLLVLEDLASGPPGTLLSSCPRYTARPAGPRRSPILPPYHTIPMDASSPDDSGVNEFTSYLKQFPVPECTDLPNKSHYKKWTH